MSDMPDFEDYLYDVLSKNDRYKSHGMWLEGFSHLCSSKTLDVEKLEDVVHYLTKNHPPFKRYISKEFFGKHATLIKNSILEDLYLPVDDNYHLALWVKLSKNADNTYNDDKCHIYFFEPTLRSIEPYKKYPAINLRFSNPVSHEINSDFVYYNNMVYNKFDIFRKDTPFDVLKKSYELIYTLIDQTQFKPLC